MTLSKFLRSHEAGRVIHEFSEIDPAAILNLFVEDDRLPAQWRENQLSGQIEKLAAARSRRAARQT